jgi:hypothetical protein
MIRRHWVPLVTADPTSETWAALSLWGGLFSLRSPMPGVTNRARPKNVGCLRGIVGGNVCAGRTLTVAEDAA